MPLEVHILICDAAWKIDDLIVSFKEGLENLIVGLHRRQGYLRRGHNLGKIRVIEEIPDVNMAKRLGFKARLGDLIQQVVERHYVVLSGIFHEKICLLLRCRLPSLLIGLRPFNSGHRRRPEKPTSSALGIFSYFINTSREPVRPVPEQLKKGTLTDNGRQQH